MGVGPKPRSLLRGSLLPLWNADDPEIKVELSPEEARRHTARLTDYLKREEDLCRWESFQAVRLVNSPMGRYALILAHDRKHQRRVYFKLFVDYEEDVFRMDLGWRDFGQYGNPGVAAVVDCRPDETIIWMRGGSD